MSQCNKKKAKTMLLKNKMHYFSLSFRTKYHLSFFSSRDSPKYHICGTLCREALNRTRQGTVAFRIRGVLRDTNALQNLRSMNNRAETQNIIHRTQLFCRVTET